MEVPSARRPTTRTASRASGSSSLSELKTESATERVRTGEPESTKRRSCNSFKSLLRAALFTMSTMCRTWSSEALRFIRTVMRACVVSGRAQVQKGRTCWPLGSRSTPWMKVGLLTAGTPRDGNAFA